MATNAYNVIEENPSKPVLTIFHAEYGGRPYLQYEITGWGGSAVPVKGGEDFSKCLGSSIRYVKQYCEKGGNLG
ncbi:hypothetical protein QUA41_28680 [Microcoleus sp. Pol11C1]|uniref:hypothetical protein n=1 Tax=unclassified Microcoleus TaxID=2642155 RepID=UPI002FD45AB1